MTEPVIIGIGATKFVKESGTKMMTLSGVASTGTFSFHDSTNTDYQVPVGKKFVVLQVCASGGAQQPAGGGQIYETVSELSYNTVTNVAGTNVFYRNWSSASYYTSLSTFYPPNEKSEVYVEVPAGNFIISANMATYLWRGHGYVITGIECDV